MSTKLKGIPPRVLIRINDSKTGSYPTLAKNSSDNRKGNYKVSYNDLNTINFSDFVSSDYNVKGGPIFDLKRSTGFYSAQNRLVAYWKFENEDISGASTRFVVDHASGTHTLTSSVVGTAVFSNVTPNPTASNGSVFSSVPTRYFTTLDANDLSFGNGTTDSPFSIAAWVNMPNLSSSINRIIVAKSGSSGREYTFGIDTALLGLAFKLWDDSTGATIRSRASSATLANIGLRENTWFHVVGTYNGGSSQNGINLYVNGKIVPQTRSSTGSYTAMENLSQSVSVLGASSNVEVFNGYLDEVAIFNKELNPLEIAQIAGHRRGISMPSGLEANSPFLTNDLMTNLFVSGTVRAGVSDQFISFTPGDNLTPFKDHDRFEQSSTSSFSLTGSAAINVGNTKFGSRLGSKTQIKFEYRLGDEGTFSPTTASIMYLAFDDGNGELPFFINVNFQGTEPAGTAPFNTANANFGNDAKLFGPFGTKTMSGSAANNRPSPFHSQIVDDAYNDAVLYVNQSSWTTNINFDPRDRELLNGLRVNSLIVPLSGTLNGPFLLEKAIIKLPLSAASNWLADRTYANVPTGSSSVWDVGGPCLTFAILNYRAEDRPTEVILSATIIPDGDNINSSITPAVPAATVPYGFNAYSGTPAAVISANSGSSFIGDVILEAEPGVSHGIYSIATSITSSFNHSQIANINPIGRSMEVKRSGRSYFRNDFLDLKRSDFTVLPVTSSLQIFKLMKFGASPYLLNPNDNLIFCISKFRPVMSTPSINRSILSGSHSVTIPSGSVFSVTLYGSLIKENSEFEDSLNQHLTSLSINQTINYEKVLDQFDIEPRLNFVSGTLDQFVTGAMVTISNGVVSTGPGRYRIGSSILKQDMSGPPNTSTRQIFREACSFQRFVQANSVERYYDSLLPRPDKMFFVHGKTPVHNQSSFYAIPTNVFIVDQASTGSIAGQGNQEWVRSFPFEPKFSAIERTVSPFRETVATRDFNDIALPAPLTTDGAGIFWAVGTAGFRIGSQASRRPSDDLVAKVLFGIGNGPSGSVDLEAAVSSNYVVNVIARGAKYGLVNWRPQFTKAIFKHNRFTGMKADMLEQRLFVKARDEAILSNVASLKPVVCEFTEINPEATFSSNLSVECTSSLPYFDGVARNRSTLLSGSA